MLVKCYSIIISFVWASGMCTFGRRPVVVVTECGSCVETVLPKTFKMIIVYFSFSFEETHHFKMMKWCEMSETFRTRPDFSSISSRSGSMSGWCVGRANTTNAMLKITYRCFSHKPDVTQAAHSKQFRFRLCAVRTSWKNFLSVFGCWERVKMSVERSCNIRSKFTSFRCSTIWWRRGHSISGVSISHPDSIKPTAHTWNIHQSQRYRHRRNGHSFPCEPVSQHQIEIVT